MKQRTVPVGSAIFEKLYAEHAGYVLSLLWLFGVAESHRDDVAQEVWDDVCRSLPRYDPRRASARAWIAGIAFNAARDWKRSRRRRRELSTHTDEEPSTTRTAETSAAEAEQNAALWSYFERAIPNEDQRKAFVLHVIRELTIQEVATATGARPWTVRWRVTMARRRLKEGLTEDERRKLLAILPVISVDGFVRALRERHFPEDGIARVWQRVTERIEREGGSIHDQLGTSGPAPSPPQSRGFTFTGRGLAGAFAGVFLVGAVAGAALLYALLSRDHEASTTTIDAELPPAQILAAQPRPEPAPTATALPSATSSPAPPASSSPTETWLLDRARKAGPAEALALAEEHAQRFPASHRAAAREEIAIKALMKLDRRADAEGRAANLIRWAPQKRQAIEELLGR